MTITDAVHQAALKIPASAWTPAVEPDGEIRDGAWVAELGAGSDCLAGWPKGIRLVVRKERPHPGAQLSFTDAGGMRLTRVEGRAIAVHGKGGARRTGCATADRDEDGSAAHRPRSRSLRA